MHDPSRHRRVTWSWVLAGICTFVLALAGPAEAGLVEAHEEALALWQETKDPAWAIEVLEEAGIKDAIKSKPANLQPAAYIHLLNDYGFFLAETAERYREAIVILKKVIRLAPTRHVAYLNLGDAYRKAAEEARRHARREAYGRKMLRQYETYGRMVQEGDERDRGPLRVRTEPGLRAEGPYELVVNRDSGLCPTLLQAVNTDLTQYGEVRYDLHPAFAAIQWRQMDFLGGKLKRKSCSFFRLAYFDMNQNGTLDIVVKFSVCFKDLFMDSIYFFDAKDPAFLSFRDSSDLRKNSLGRFPEETGILGAYLLETLPLEEEENGTADAEGVSGWMIINPFLYHGAAYLAVTDRGGRGNDPVGEGFVVGKYQSPGKLDDVCYFRKKEIKRSKGSSNKTQTR